MSEYNQTPASRRFLPPSSSSRLQQSSSARKAQFAFPSQPTGSTSPFVQTPRPQQVGRFDDDIEINYEPRTGSSTLSDSRNQLRKQKLNKHDSIEDYDDNVESYLYEQAPFQLMSAHHNHNNDLESNTNLEASTSSPRPDFSSPLPKRQKTSHLYESGVDPIDVSSSPSPDSVELWDYERTPTGEADDAETADTAMAHIAKPRFKVVPMLVEDDRMPSPRQPTRSAFKGISTGGNPWKETPLPATFSPSKRKGKYEYVRGGAAETVRSWILDIANDHSRDAATSRLVDVEPTFTDSSGRFEMARDREGQPWMFVRQEGQTVALNQASGYQSGGEKKVIVKGSKTTWKVEVSDLVSAGQLPATLQVAVLWDVEAGKSKQT